MARKFAEGTEVPVDRTKAEIDRLLRQRAAEKMASAEENGRAIVLFEMSGRRIRFSMPLPSRREERFLLDGRGRKLSETQAYERWERECRALWRGLLMAMKSRFVNVDNGIETFEMAFLPHTVMPDGKTVAEHVLPAVASAYKNGRMMPLLPSGE